MSKASAPNQNQPERLKRKRRHTALEVSDGRDSDDGEGLGVDAFLLDVPVPAKSPADNQASPLPTDSNAPKSAPSRRTTGPSGTSQKGNVRERTRRRLEALTAEKEVIMQFTRWAEVARKDAPAVAEEVITALKQAPSNRKLPLWFVLDSISNTVPEPYADLFAPQLGELIEQAMPPGNEEVERSYLRLLHTWQAKAKVGTLWPAKWWLRAEVFAVLRQLKAELRSLRIDSQHLREDIAIGCARLALANQKYASSITQFILCELRRNSDRQNFPLWGLLDQLSRSHITNVYRNQFEPYLQELLEHHSPGRSSQTFARLLRHWLQKDVFPGAVDAIRNFLEANKKQKIGESSTALHIDSASEKGGRASDSLMRSPPTPGTPPPPEDDLQAPCSPPTPPSPEHFDGDDLFERNMDSSSQSSVAVIDKAPQEVQLKVTADAKAFLLTPGIPYLQHIQSETSTTITIHENVLSIRGYGDGLQEASDRMQRVLEDEVPVVEVMTLTSNQQLAPDEIQTIGKATQTRLSMARGLLTIVGRSFDVRAAAKQVKEKLVTPSACHRLTITPDDYETVKAHLSKVGQTTQTHVTVEKSGAGVALLISGEWPAVQTALQSITTLLIDGADRTSPLPSDELQKPLSPPIAPSIPSPPVRYAVRLQGLPLNTAEEAVKVAFSRTYMMSVQDVSFPPPRPGDSTCSAVVTIERPELVSRVLNGKPFIYCGRTIQLTPYHTVAPWPHPVPSITFQRDVLLLGEGNFTFAAAVARLWTNGVGIMASTLESKDEVINLYGPEAQRAILECHLLGVNLHFNLDATLEDFRIRGKKFRHIVMNFPESGAGQDPSHSQISVHGNKVLLRAVMLQAMQLLEAPGRLHIALQDIASYRATRVHELGRAVGLELVDIVPFRPECWPGYQYADPTATGPCQLTQPYFFSFAPVAAGVTPTATAFLYPVLLAKDWFLQDLIDSGVLKTLPALTHSTVQALQDHLLRCPPMSNDASAIRKVIVDFFASQPPVITPKTIPARPGPYGKPLFPAEIHPHADAACAKPPLLPAFPPSIQRPPRSIFTKTLPTKDDIPSEPPPPYSSFFSGTIPPF